MHVESRHYAGGWWDWLTPFSILTGLALAVGYALLGATWLVLKTEGELREKAYRLSWYLLFAMLGAIGMVSLATPFLHIHYAARWFTWPNVILTAPVPLAVGGLAALGRTLHGFCGSRRAAVEVQRSQIDSGSGPIGTSGAPSQ